jgi:hypothetical protein
MDHVDGGQSEIHRAVGGDVHLVGGGEAVLGIAELPPPLVTDHLDLEGVVLGFGRRPDVEERGEGRHRHHGQDHRRDDRPGDLELGVAVQLAHPALLALALPEPQDPKEQGDRDEYENDRGDPEHHPEQGVHLLGDGSGGVQRVLGDVAPDDPPEVGGVVPGTGRQGKGGNDYEEYNAAQARHTVCRAVEHQGS